MAVVLSGATQSSLARLIEEALNHTRIDNLFVHFEVEPLRADFSPNKLKKAQHLVSELATRPPGERSLMALINYVGSPSFGIRELQRGAPTSEDFYAHLDRDLERGHATNSMPAETVPRPTERQFKRPGTTAPAEVPTPAATAGSAAAAPAQEARRRVFVIRGRDNAAYAALEALLEALDLRVVSWDDASAAAAVGTPHTLDIVEAGMAVAHAVVVLFTPDDLGRVKREFFDPVRDHPAEARDSGQARQNVVFEAGWAMARDRKRVIMVRVGEIRGLSDIDGLNYVWLDGNISSRRALVVRLRSADLEVDDSREGWRTAGDFPSHV